MSPVISGGGTGGGGAISGVSITGTAAAGFVPLASSASAGTWSYPSLTTAQASITSPVTIVTAGTFVDGPSITIVAGTWLIAWKILFQVIVTTSQSYAFTGRLWDGTTVYDEGETSFPNAIASLGWSTTYASTHIVTLGAGATLKISGTTNHSSSSAQLSSDPPDSSGATHTATTITGVRLA